MSAPPPPPPPLVKPAEIPGRGRGLIAARSIKPGEIILVDSPLLLYPSETTVTSSHSFCSHCFRSFAVTITSPRILCPSSCPSSFCSPLCLSSHTSTLCHSLRHLRPSGEQSFFLAAAYALSISSPSNFSRLLSLHGDPEPIPHSLPSPFPAELNAALLAKDRLNAFGLMEPFREGQGDRNVRAYGIYPLAAMFNHDCLPNACRFDYVDRNDGRNTDMVIRAIHEISEGREVCLSYFPVNWGYKERQKRLMEDYGFRCECDRCLVEKNWKEEEEEDDDEGIGEVSSGGDEDVMEGMEEDDGGDFPHAYFFVKFVCDREDCGGTLAPVPPSPEGVVSDVMECNVCGRLRKDEDDDGDGDMIDDE